VKFLTEVGRLKTLQAYRDQVRTQKRSMAREEPLGEHVDPAEGPAEQAADEDAWAYLLNHQSERDRAALEGLRAGEGLKELARRMNSSVKLLLIVANRAARTARVAVASERSL